MKHYKKSISLLSSTINNLLNRSTNTNISFRWTFYLYHNYSLQVIYHLTDFNLSINQSRSIIKQRPPLITPRSFYYFIRLCATSFLLFSLIADLLWTRKSIPLHPLLIESVKIIIPPPPTLPLENARWIILYITRNYPDYSRIKKINIRYLRLCRRDLLDVEYVVWGVIHTGYFKVDIITYYDCYVA